MLKGGDHTRRQAFGAELPEPPGGDPLAEVWGEAGYVSLGGNGGMRPIEWAELQAFAAMAGHDLHPFWWRTIRAMSAAYVAGMQDDNPLSIMPSERG